MTREKKHKKSHHGAGSLFYRPDRKKWVVQVVVDGKAHQTYFSSKEEGEAYTAKASYETKYEGIKPADRRQTVFAYCAAWLNLKAGISANVKDTYKGHLERYLKGSHLGNMKLADAERNDVRVFVKGLVDAGKSAAYIGHIMTPLKQAFRQAHEDDTIPRNPCIGVKLPAPRKGAGKAMSADEVGRLLAAVRADRYASKNYALFALAFASGARIGELLALKWSCLDLETGALRIEASLRREKDAGPVIGTPKTKTSNRTLPLTPELVALLKKHRSVQKAARLEAVQWEPNDLIFCTHADKSGTAPGGRPLEHSNVRRTWNRLLKVADLARYRLYDTRHTVLTRLAEARENPDLTRMIAGHADVRTTLNYYTHSTHSLLREAVSKLPSYESDEDAV